MGRRHAMDESTTSLEMACRRNRYLYNRNARLLAYTFGVGSCLPLPFYLFSRSASDIWVLYMVPMISYPKVWGLG